LKPLGITMYDAKQDPIQCLRCYALSIENCHTCFSNENQVHNYMHARIKFHAYSYK
jgi:hypothetical protein